MHNVHRGREKREERRISRNGSSDVDQGDVFGSTAAELQSLDLNHATAPQLAAIEEIEPALAQAIVEHRVHHGHYKSWEELAQLPGMTEQKLLQIQRAARLGGQADASGRLSQH
jgi:DNA uptake protein ComE-like DNA-binding protein